MFYIVNVEWQQDQADDKRKNIAMIQEVHRIITGDPEEVGNIRNTRMMHKSIGYYPRAEQRAGREDINSIVAPCHYTLAVLFIEFLRVVS